MTKAWLPKGDRDPKIFSGLDRTKAFEMAPTPWYDRGLLWRFRYGVVQLAKRLMRVDYGD